MLTLNDTSKELLANLDSLNTFYIENKDEHLEKHDNFYIDHILIATYLSLCEAPLPQLNKVYIKKSNIEGLGVFALDYIKKGEIVSLYPSDIVRLYHGKEYYQVCADYAKVEVNPKYAYKINDYCTIIADSQCHDMNLAGHIINDSVKLESDQYQLYHDLSQEKRNCLYYPYHLFILIVASKDIHKDEELLVSYGVPYWYVLNSSSL